MLAEINWLLAMSLEFFIIECTLIVTTNNAYIEKQPIKLL
jgi:hypothetical protein